MSVDMGTYDANLLAAKWMRCFQVLESLLGLIMLGKKLRHYQITRQLGRGGMGEVYKAKDRILGRDVAIHALPELARNSDRVVRFQREAKLLDSLPAKYAALSGLKPPAYMR